MPLALQANGASKDLLRYGQDFRETKGGLKLHPKCEIFGPQPFIIFKSSHQDLSNEGSIFVLSLLEVGF